MTEVIVFGGLGLLALLSLLCSAWKVIQARRRPPQPGPLWARVAAVHMASADPRSRAWRRR